MNDEIVFSPEYIIEKSTDAVASKNDDKLSEDKKSAQILESIENDYKLSKPRRKIIRARII